MIKDIYNKEFNFYLERCHAELKSYPEGTAKELELNIQNQEKLTEEGISKEIINIGSYCRGKGVNEIIISSLICPKGQHHNSRVLKVNDYLQKFCFESSKRYHLCRDGLHLLESSKVCRGTEEGGPD